MLIKKTRKENFSSNLVLEEKHHLYVFFNKQPANKQPGLTLKMVVNLSNLQS